MEPILLLLEYLEDRGFTAVTVEISLPGISVLRLNNHYAIMYVAFRQTFKSGRDIAHIADPDCFEKVLAYLKSVI